jgi:hypothetical protein
MRSIARPRSSCVVGSIQRVLVDQEHRLSGCEPLELIDQHLKRALLLALRRQFGQ